PLLPDVLLQGAHARPPALPCGLKAHPKPARPQQAHPAQRQRSFALPAPRREPAAPAPPSREPKLPPAQALLWRPPPDRALQAPPLPVQTNGSFAQAAWLQQWEHRRSRDSRPSATEHPRAKQGAARASTAPAANRHPRFRQCLSEKAAAPVAAARTPHPPAAARPRAAPDRPAAPEPRPNALALQGRAEHQGLHRVQHQATSQTRAPPGSVPARQGNPHSCRRSEFSQASRLPFRCAATRRAHLPAVPALQLRRHAPHQPPLPLPQPLLPPFPWLQVRYPVPLASARGQAVRRSSL